MMSHPIEEMLISSGFMESDIKLGQQLTRTSLVTHRDLTQNIRTCESCALSLECHGQDNDYAFVTTERVTGSGPWNAPLMIVGEMPGEDEAKFKAPFLGAEGQVLSFILAKAGVSRDAVYMTYAIKCAGTRQPTNEEWKTCRKHIEAEIKAVKPRVIITLGEYAMKSVNPNSHSIENSRNMLWTGNNYEIVHTHDVRAMFGGPDQPRIKGEFWSDLSLAVSTVKTAVPNYPYM